MNPDNDIGAPPLLLAVLVQVVAQACHLRLRSSLQKSVTASLHTEDEGEEVVSQVLLELLASTPQTGDRTDMSPRPPPRPYGCGYPDSAIESFCVALYACARQPEEPPRLPRLDMPGIVERNPFNTHASDIPPDSVVKRGLERDVKIEEELRRQIAFVVGDIDENIDMMNIPECKAVLPGLDIMFGCLSSFFSPEPPRPAGHSSARLLCDDSRGSQQKVVLECVVGHSPPSRVQVRLPAACIDRTCALLVALLASSAHTQGCAPPSQPPVPPPSRLLYLTGLRCTVGSLAERCPPPRHLLVEAFNAPHIHNTSKPNSKSKSILTVGARALCKHAPRSADGFWTCSERNMTGSGMGGESVARPLTGSEASKNEQANAKLLEILDSGVWINLHSMLDAGRGTGSGRGAADESRSSSSCASSVCVLEVRVASGHGARWSWRDPGRWSLQHKQRLYEQLVCNKSEGALEIEMEGAPNAAGRGVEVKFRGFVEPLVIGGHEKKWRH